MSTVETEYEIEEIDPEIAAIHESGHATVCRLLQFPAGEVSIASDGMPDSITAGYSISGSAEHCADEWRRKGRDTFLNLTPVHARAVVAMAGVAAEITFFGDHCQGHDVDWDTVNSLIDNEAEKFELWKYTCELVHQYADIIETVALMLIERRRLSGKELDEIVATLRSKR